MRTPFRPSLARRSFVHDLLAGTAIIALSGARYALADERAQASARTSLRSDGRPRLPPGQHLIERLRPMGGEQGDPSPRKFRLRVHGEVDAPYLLDFAALLRMPQVEQTCDVHCVTRWSVLDSRWAGVRIAELIAHAKPKPDVRHVVFEAAHGYTSNLPLREALAPNVLVAHHHEGRPLALAHGAPARALVPDLYFWKSAKWLTGIYLSSRDRPGYWETRGYHNHGDPWREERDGSW